MNSFCYLAYVNENTTGFQKHLKKIYFLSSFASLGASVIFEKWKNFSTKKNREDIEKYYIIVPFLMIAFYAAEYGTKTLHDRILSKNKVSNTTTKKSDSKKS